MSRNVRFLYVVVSRDHKCRDAGWKTLTETKDPRVCLIDMSVQSRCVPRVRVSDVVYTAVDGRAFDRRFRFLPSSVTFCRDHVLFQQTVQNCTALNNDEQRRRIKRNLLHIKCGLNFFM